MWNVLWDIVYEIPVLSDAQFRCFTMTSIAQSLEYSVSCKNSIHLSGTLTNYTTLFVPFSADGRSMQCKMVTSENDQDHCCPSDKESAVTAQSW
jgi:hypothetical protein